MWPVHLRLNLTEECKDGSTSTDNADFLYEGRMLFYSTDYGDNTTDGSWVDRILNPTIELHYDNETAFGSINGLFEMDIGNFGGFGYDLVGDMTISFRADIDKNRSDELRLGLSKPAWNALLGFEIESKAGWAQPEFAPSYCLFWAGMVIFLYCPF